MKKIPLPILLFLIVFLAGYAGFFVFQFIYDPKPTDEEVENSQAPMSMTEMLSIGQSRPEFEMSDQDGNMHKISEWDGKIIILNFWATWCPPCREELPEFVELQKKYADQGVQFIGIAVDSAENVKAFNNEIPLNYPNLVDEVEGMKISGIYGNGIGALPYTVLISPSGQIVKMLEGGVKKATLETLLKPLLSQVSSE